MQFVSSAAVAGLVALIFVCRQAPGAPTADQPNVLFILTDDQGNTTAAVFTEVGSDQR